MFGYVQVASDGLSDEEKERYRAVYCGLCRALGQRHGIAARLSLNYEMTFLILLLSSLYEPPEVYGTFRCGIHPWKKSICMTNEITAYAADMTVALAYHPERAFYQNRSRWPPQAGLPSFSCRIPCSAS